MATNITMLLIGLLFFTSLIAGASIFYNDMTQIYNPTAVTDVTIISDMSGNITGLTESSQGKLTGQGSQTISAADIILTGGWTALINLVSLPDTVGKLIANVVNPTSEGGMGITFIPAWFIGLIIGVIVIFVTWRLVGIATRSESGGV